MKQLRTLLAAATLLLASCETVVDVPVPTHTPRLAITYTLSNQTPNAEYRKFFTVRELFVSASQGVLETKALQGRNDATVELLDASGQVVERFRHKARGGYGYYTPSGILKTDSVQGYYVPVLNFAGTPGQTYTLRASAPGLEAVEAALTLPDLPSIARADYAARAQSGQQTYYGGEPGRLTLSVADNAATTDYYLAYARVLDKNGRYWGRVRVDYNSSNNSADVTVDRFQLSDASSLYNQAPYSDANGNGKLLNLGVDVVLIYDNYTYPPPTQQPAPKPAFIEVIVSNVTPDTYRFYQSLQRYYDTDGNPFAEPAPLFSNFRPGYGIFGGSTDTQQLITL